MKIQVQISWVGQSTTWTSTTLLLACLRPPATRSHLLTSSLFQHCWTQHRKGKQELLTLWIGKGRIHGCAPIFLLPHRSEEKFVRRKKSRIWVPLDFPAVFVFQITVWVPGPAPGLCQRRHSGKVICHRVTCHFSNLGPGTSKIYQTVCPPLLGNSIFQMTCISSDAHLYGMADQSNLIWLNLYS